MLAQNLYVDCDVTHESSLQTIIIKMIHVGNVRGGPFQVLSGIEKRY